MNDRISLAPERSGRIYIAGPMTGLPDYNFPAFNDMAAILRGLGYSARVVTGADGSPAVEFLSPVTIPVGAAGKGRDA